MKKAIYITSAFLISTFSIVSFAEKGEPGSGPNPYSDCGIGAALFSNTNWAAVSSNVIWDIGTTAVTSATASPETCQGKSVEAASFINHSYDNLVEDTAKGEGEYLTTMLNIYGCDQAARDEVVHAIRASVSESISKDIYTNKSYAEKVYDYYNVVNGTIVNDFSLSCSA